jgi:phosphoribosyl-ATP pyrophosphohydrolase/phosphoribosyl-AMP cyclohydrolase
MKFETPEWLADVEYNDAGLVPCIVQHAATSEVLMMAWMSQESIAKTLETGETWFYSRSRQELWHKGATSGNRQILRSLHLDCDGDTLLALVTTTGDAACHLGTRSCWDAPEGDATRSVGGAPRHILAELRNVIEQRDKDRPEGSYTTQLLEGGVDRAGKKVGEEATEVVIAAKNAVEGRGTEELAEESADLLYHLLVLWQCAGIDVDDIAKALEERH